MLEDTCRFRFNHGHAVSEVFDQEVLVVNLDTGTYYSLVETSAKIWQWLVDGASIAETVENLAAVYDGDRADIDAQTRAFIAELVSDNLVLVADDVSPLSAPPSAPQPRQPFKAPRLERFTDMQELLLLDPVHDVRDTGWPAAAPPSRTRSKS